MNKGNAIKNGIQKRTEMKMSMEGRFNLKIFIQIRHWNKESLLSQNSDYVKCEGEIEICNKNAFMDKCRH